MGASCSAGREECYHAKMDFQNKLQCLWKFQSHKSRLVAKVYSRQQGMHFDETLSPIAHFVLFRTTLAFADQLCWHVYQSDVQIALLNGDLQQ